MVQSLLVYVFSYPHLPARLIDSELYVKVISLLNVSGMKVQSPESETGEPVLKIFRVHPMNGPIQQLLHMYHAAFNFLKVVVKAGRRLDFKAI